MHQLISIPEEIASPIREIRHHRKIYACLNYCRENKHYDLPFSLQLYESSSNYFKSLFECLGLSFWLPRIPITIKISKVTIIHIFYLKLYQR